MKTAYIPNGALWLYNTLSDAQKVRNKLTEKYPQYVFRIVANKTGKLFHIEIAN